VTLNVNIFQSTNNYAIKETGGDFKKFKNWDCLPVLLELMFLPVATTSDLGPWKFLEDLVEKCGFSSLYTTTLQ
jgi:hypothetical protein